MRLPGIDMGIEVDSGVEKFEKPGLLDGMPKPPLPRGGELPPINMEGMDGRPPGGLLCLEGISMSAIGRSPGVLGGGGPKDEARETSGAAVEEEGSRPPRH